MATLPRRGLPLTRRLGWLLGRAVEASALGAVPLAVLATLPLPAWGGRAGWTLIAASAATMSAFLANDVFDWATDAYSPGRRLRAPQVGISVPTLVVGSLAFASLAVYASLHLGLPAMLAIATALSAGLVYALWGKRHLWVGFASHAVGVAALVFLASRVVDVSLPPTVIPALFVWAWIGWLGRAAEDRQADVAAGVRTPATAWTVRRFQNIRRTLTWLAFGLFGVAALSHPPWWPWALAASLRLLTCSPPGAWWPRMLAALALLAEVFVVTVRG